jgi:hypothetical protein
VAWKSPTSPVAKKFRSQPSAGKIMLTLFWDMEGVILVHFAPMKEALRGRRFSSDEVNSEMQNWLKTTPKNFYFSDGIKKCIKR